MVARNKVDAPDAAVNGRYFGRNALPVNDVGRLLLRCADRPGLVAAVTTFLAQAGANIVSLDQHSTEQSGGTFMQRTIFHLPGLTAARDALERDFGEQVAARFNMDFGLTEAAKPKRVAIMASKPDHCLPEPDPVRRMVTARHRHNPTKEGRSFMKKPIEDDAEWTLIRPHLEFEDLPPLPSSKPPQRYPEISCGIPRLSTDLKRAFGAVEPQSQSRIDWRNVAVWAGIAAVSALWMTGLIWFIQTIIQAAPI
jgi:hypothetical protein